MVITDSARAVGTLDVAAVTDVPPAAEGPAPDAVARASDALALIAAHAFHPLHRPLRASIGLGILTAGHRHGWAVAEGGPRRVTLRHLRR